MHNVNRNSNEPPRVHEPASYDLGIKIPRGKWPWHRNTSPKMTLASIKIVRNYLESTQAQAYLSSCLKKQCVSRNAFKCTHINNNFFLSQSRSINIIGINITLTLSTKKPKQVLSHRFSHIFQSSYNLVNGRSQGFWACNRVEI